MKTFQEIISQKPVFLNRFEDEYSVLNEFLSFKGWNPKILFASYGTEYYEGTAFVLFLHKGTLYEVNASHCSACGLEDQFSPEKTSLKAIENRLVYGELGKDEYNGNLFANEFKEFLGIE